MPKKNSATQVQTIADIARLAGVSKSTVSRALSGSTLICEETRGKIQKIARSYNFQINVPARRLSMQESKTIAFVTHSLQKEFSVADLFTLEILGGITGGLKEQGFDLLMLNVDPCDSNWPEQHLAAGKVDGFILMTSSRKQAHIKMLIEEEAPFIAWGHPHDKWNYCTVIGDDRSGGRLAAERLLSLGRKRIAFLGGPAMEKEAQLRHAGFLEALQAAGLPPQPDLEAHGDYSSASGAEAMRTLLSRNADLDAVFVAGDMMAIAAMRVLHEAGRRMPDDTAVVGYDNLSIADQVTPPLTTVSQNIPLVGRMLALNLLQYLQTRVVTHATVPVELVLRQSA